MNAVNRKPAHPHDILGSFQSDEGGFIKLAALLKLHAGINLPNNEKNRSLMASRLNQKLKARGILAYREYAKLLESGDREILHEFVSALTTNTTEFFRESKHYDILKAQLPDIVKGMRARGSDELRVWCAASSTGQEPYSILITIREMYPDLKVRMLATDIDLKVLEEAALAEYTENETKTLPPMFKQKYFEKSSSKVSPVYTVAHGLRQDIRFAPFNLLTPEYPFKHPFDLVFCRNVLIYFDSPTAASVIHKLALATRPGGHLFLGHSESGLTKTPLLKTIAAAVYVRKPNA